MSLRDDLMAAMQVTAAQKPRSVEVKGWPPFYVREVTVGEAEAQAEDMAEKGDKNRIARGAARVICDEHGERLFDPAEEADVELLARQPWALLRKAIEDKPEGN